MEEDSCPLISIVTVCLNAEDVIEETLKSVIEQDFTPKEYIVVDGASTDKTKNILEKYREHIDILISEKDSGIYNAMNKAVSFAEGEWIIFMNAGDLFASNHTLADVFSTLNDDVLKNTDIIYGNTIQVRSVGRFVLPNHPLEFLLKGMSFCHQSVFVKTFLLKTTPFNEKYQILSDFDFLRQSYIDGRTFLYIPLEIACFEAESGVSAKRKLLRKKENAMVRGIHKSLKWRLYYILYVGGFYLKKIFKTILPNKLVNGIRRLNYKRKEKRKYNKS